MQVNFKKSRQVLHREKRIDWFNSTKKKHLRNAAGRHSVEKANTLFAPSADYIAIRKEEITLEIWLEIRDVYCQFLYTT